MKIKAARANLFFAAVFFAAAAFLSGFGCADQCLKGIDPSTLAPPSEEEYRLSFTNESPQMVELTVDGESKGLFCPHVAKAAVGNFKRSRCAKIKAKFFDVDREKLLDDCAYLGYPECSENNKNGETCFDTTISSYEITAEIK